jgi:exodeoxyribonuclease V beta subunit
MDASHYTLQAHLYLVALHRYLRVRLPGYDYDRHIGGAAYAFLRGFANGPSDTGLGWYTDRPSRALIEALSAVMDGAPQGAA